jgi:glucan-binding YG repeat protein
MNDSSGEWKHDDKGWWYAWSGGGCPKNKWEKIEGEWYCFDAEGYMRTGWIDWNGQWYYCKKTSPGSGKMLTGWQTLKWDGRKCKFYFDDTGAMFPGGFHLIKGRWYAFDKDGVLITDDADIVVNKNGSISIK